MRNRGITMSEFSEKCKDYITRSGESIYSMAKRSGLDWTTLQKMTQGKRLPGKAYVESLCDYLALNKAERQELIRLYQIEKIGKKVYNCRLEIESFLDDFYMLKENLEKFVTQNEPGRLKAVNPERYHSSSSLISGADIHNSIQYVIQQAYQSDEEIQIYMDVSELTLTAMEQMIYEERHTEKTANCTQLIKFARTEDAYEGACDNIKILRKIFPFAITTQGQYDVIYFYSKNSSLNCMYELWPHYIVTKSCVLLISGDEKSAMIIQDEKLAQHYISEIRKICEGGRKLLAGAGDVKNAMEIIQKYVPQKDFVISYETAPCLAGLLAPVRNLLTGEGNEIVQEYMAMYDDNPWTENSEKKIIYSFHGMEKFLRTGVLPGIGGEYVPPLPPEVRKTMATGYIQSMQDSNNGYLLKDTAHVPQYYLSIILYAPNIVVFISMEKGMNLGAVILEEPSLFRIFQEYFENMIKEEQTWSAEESSRQFLTKCEEIWASMEE